MEKFGDSFKLVHNQGKLVLIPEELLLVSNKSETISEIFALTLGERDVLAIFATSA